MLYFSNISKNLAQVYSINTAKFIKYAILNYKIYSEGFRNVRFGLICKLIFKTR